MSSTRGLFVVFDGPDGVGKSSLVKAVAARLDELGYSDIVVTREPSDGVYGQRVRAVLRGEAQATAHELAALFADDRVDHLRREILPRLLDGCTVLCDRYLLSSMVYQYAVTGVPSSTVRHMNRYAPPADVMFLLDAPIELCMERMGKRGTTKDIMETNQAQWLAHCEYQNRIHWTWAANKTMSFDATQAIGELTELATMVIIAESTMHNV